jgi:hypothetical protein
VGLGRASEARSRRLNVYATIAKGAGLVMALQCERTHAAASSSDLNENATAFHDGLEDAETHDTIEPNGAARLDVEAKEMPGADHGLALDLAEADRAVHVRAAILEGGDLSALPARERDLRPIF